MCAKRENCRCTSFHGVRRWSRAGLRRNAVYLVRPDGYVALANAEGIATAVTSYLDAHQITTAPDARIGITAALS